MVSDSTGPEKRSSVRAFAALARLVMDRFSDVRCVQVAGSLTFTTLLALVPVIAIAFTMIAAFPVFEDWANEIKIFILLNFVPEAGGRIITGYMQQFADNATRLTAAGVALLAVTALLLMMTIEHVFDVVWRVRRPRPLARRMLVYWMAVTVGPLLIGASLSVTSWVVTQSLGVTREVPGFGRAVLALVPWVLNAIAFALLYLVVPNRRVRLADALAGGIAAAVAFELMKRGFGFYVASVPTYTAVYGTFATIPIFLLWIYLSWMVVLFGAVITAVLPTWRAAPRGETEAPGRSLFVALRTLRALDEARKASFNLDTARIARAAAVADERAEEVLVRMESRRWVQRASEGDWALVADLSVLTVAELYRLFVLRPPGTGEATRGGALDAFAASIAARIDESLAMPVAELFASVGDAARDGSPGAPAQRIEAWTPGPDAPRAGSGA